MQVPKNVRKQKEYMKECQYEGCKQVFKGISIAKYCHKHRAEEFRVRKRETCKPSDTNRIINYALPRASKTMLVCECCKQEFDATLYPRQVVYPKYCPEHTNAHRRKIYEKSLSQGNARGLTV